MAPALGLLLDSWPGLVIGIVVYLGSREYSPEEERTLSRAFGPAWDDYSEKVMVRWL